MSIVKNYIFSQVAKKQLNEEEAKKMLFELKKENNSKEIAIIGIGLKFPKAENYNEYWNNLKNGINCIDDLPENRKKDAENYFYNIYGRMYSIDHLANKDIEFEKQGYLNEVDKFDSKFFNISPREAKAIEPIQRLFLQTAYECFEDAGYGGDRINHTNTGVYVGRNHTKSNQYDFLIGDEPLAVTGTWTGILSSRLSYIFDLRGPSIVIDTACSSGLVAVHEACKALINEECEQAIAAGVSGISYDPIKGLDFSLDNYESKDGCVKTFDNNADGTVWGEGVGVLLLKQLDKAIKDKDNIYCVLKGSAINNDGFSNGITAPNALAQENMLLEAWKKSDIDPNSISYIETHGTGTVLGDPIEVKALTNAFIKFTNKKQFCGIGSVKTNLGHLVGASGLASIIKVILALKYKEIPPSINFSYPNKYINFQNSPFYVVSKHKKWDSDKKRIAGVSSFGFNGTNCHVILEEYNQNRSSDDVMKPGILTLSCKTESALRNLILQFKKFIFSNDDSNDFYINDVCYTSNIGRGHYRFRLGIINYNKEDLFKKINLLNIYNYKILESEGIYFGEHSIVSENKVEKDCFEITDRKRNEYTEKANVFLNQFIETDNKDTVLLDNICKLYVKGADIDWYSFHKNKHSNKVRIPVYPFDRIRYWPGLEFCQLKESNGRNSYKTDDIDHPLFDFCLTRSIYQDIYITKFNVDKHWVLSDHRILGEHIVPGTTFLEMIKYLCNNYFQNELLEYKDIIFYTPVIVKKNSEKEVQTIIIKEKEYIKFIIASKKDDIANNLDEWTVHSEGKVFSQKSNKVNDYKIKELLKNKINIDNDINENVLDENIIKFGKRWQLDKQRYMIEKDYLIDIKLPSDLEGDLLDYYLHPSLLDNAVNEVSQDIFEGFYLPLAYKSIKIYNSIPGSFYSFIKLKDNAKQSSETITFNIILIDKNGRTIIEIEDYSIKKVNKLALDHKKTPLNSFKYYYTHWIEDELNNIPDQVTEGYILLLKGTHSKCDELIKKLQKQNQRLILVESGEEYKKIDDYHFFVSSSEESYIQLINELSWEKLQKICHMFTLDKNFKNDDSYEEFNNKLKNGLYSLFYLIKAIVKSKIKKRLNLYLFSFYANEITKNENYISAENHAFFNLGKVVEQEYENLHLKCIDIDDQTDEKDIINEINITGDQYKVGIRNNIRYKEELAEYNNNKKENRISIKENGVYIITGGLGKLALEIARHLSVENNINLCLINRSVMPEQDKWDQLSNDNKYSYKIDKIKQIKRNGSNVEFYQADVSDENELKNVINNIEEKYKSIDGIIHCAGVAGEGFLAWKEEAVFNNVIKPKIHGTWLINKLTKKENLDFIIFFSSITSITGGYGQGDYAAANGYMDAFALKRLKIGKKTISINWSPWEEIGMAVDFGIVNDNRSSFELLKTDDALEYFKNILEYSLTNILPGELNLKSLSSDLNDKGEFNFLPFNFSNKIMNEIRNQNNISAKIDNKTDKFNNVTFALKGKKDNHYDEIEKKLAYVWAKTFGVDEIDIYDDFKSLGGDSVIAIELLKEIENELGGIIDITDIFSYPSIYKMSEYVKLKLNKHVDQEIQNDKQDLSDDKIKDILNDLENNETTIEEALKYFDS